MAGRGTTRGGQLAVLLAAALAAVLAVLTAGPPAQAQPRASRPAAASVAEEHVECAHQHEAQAPMGRAAGRHRANGGPSGRGAARPGEADAGVPGARAATGPAAVAGGSRPAALARLQVFRC
ncbi:hypothetical protein Kpho02_33170 [Kitasatospora phosalacinea]|uniref:Uncharacterized protein n=1 Tax=Kitasatospora phosalacinea TaxID=2065 RepID=A0A9W6Q9T9_9ACTN|nr:hypothetical protein [Kitasatospora phosalacinea]GLW71018.1 hypothetical protein Kpho02_33170 [Kitasatospora phosalacinea]